MSGDIKLTIGICVKNAEATIGKTIESVINQDFPHELMEIIIVDGGSEDRTLEIIRNKLKSSGVKNKIFYEREGLGYARQIIVDNAQGEYIIWVDSDMMLPKDFVRKQVSYMEKNPEVAIAKGKYGICKGENLVARLEDIEFSLIFGQEGEVHLPSLGSLGASGCIYRVNAVRQVGGFDKSIKGAGEDTDIEYRIEAAGWKLHVTSAVFYEKRRDTWKALWDEYFWLGLGASRVFKKNRKAINIYKMMPPVAILTEFSRIPKAYKLNRSIAALFLPFHYIFKRIAWLIGFIKGKFSHKT